MLFIRYGKSWLGIKKVNPKLHLNNEYVNPIEIGNSFYYPGRYFDFEMTSNEPKKWLTLINLGGEGGGLILPPCWFSLNDSETVKAVTLALCSI